MKIFSAHFLQESLLFLLKIRVGLTIEPVRLWVLTIVTLSSVNSSTFLKSYLLFSENQLIVTFSRLLLDRYSKYHIKFLRFDSGCLCMLHETPNVYEFKTFMPLHI